MPEKPDLPVPQSIPRCSQQLNVVSSAAWPCRAHGVQSGFLKILVNLARMAVEVLGDNFDVE
jgi:hypothetical protein